MESLLYFLLWGAFIFFMMRFGCGAHIMGHGHGNEAGKKGAKAGDTNELRWVAPDKDIDPVCGEAVQTDTAKPSVFDGTVYYFCSRECREAFEAAPKHYLGEDDAPSHPKLERSHV